SYLGLAADEVRKEGDLPLLEQLRGLRQAIGDLRQRMNSGNAAQVSLKLTEFQRALFNDIHATFETLETQDDRAPLTVSDLPAALRNRVIGRSGRYLLYVYPKENVWERDKQEAFVRDLRSVDRNVTGTPVQLYEYTTLLKNSYEQAAWYALAAIIVLVLIHFLTISTVTVALVCVVLALLPVGLGSL